MALNDRGEIGQQEGRQAGKCHASKENSRDQGSGSSVQSACLFSELGMGDGC